MPECSKNISIDVNLKFGCVPHQPDWVDPFKMPEFLIYGLCRIRRHAIVFEQEPFLALTDIYATVFFNGTPELITQPLVVLSDQAGIVEIDTGLLE